MGWEDVFYDCTGDFEAVRALAVFESANAPFCGVCVDIAGDEEDLGVFENVNRTRTVVNGIVIDEHSQSESLRSFSTSSSTATAFSCTEASTSTTSEVQGCDNDPDGMHVFEVHDTIRQLDFPSTRKRKQPVVARCNALKIKKLDPQSIQAVKGHYCARCKSQCADVFSFEEISKERNEYWAKDQVGRKQFLVDKLVFDSVADHEACMVNFKHVIQGKSVCGPFFKELYSVSNDLYRDVRMRVCRGNTHVIGRVRTTTWTWMRKQLKVTWTCTLRSRGSLNQTSIILIFLKESASKTYTFNSWQTITKKGSGLPHQVSFTELGVLLELSTSVRSGLPSQNVVFAQIFNFKWKMEAAKQQKVRNCGQTQLGLYSC